MLGSEARRDRPPAAHLLGKEPFMPAILLDSASKRAFPDISKAKRENRGPQAARVEFETGKGLRWVRGMY